MSLNRDDVRFLFAKMRAAKVQGVPNTMEQPAMVDDWVNTMPDYWTRDMLVEAFYSYRRVGRVNGRFWPAPGDFIHARAADNVNPHLKQVDKDREGCDICKAHGDPKSGWVTVYRPNPPRETRARDPHGMDMGHWAPASIVSGVIRCPCWKAPENEKHIKIGFDLRGWLEGWRHNMEWHEWAIEHSNKATKQLDELRFQRQQVLAAQVLGRVG